MSPEDPIEVKNWRREKVLGSGGFGTVTLWKNKNGDEMIALKKCRCGADSLLTSKQKERWKKEVEIMQRLNHPNVVRALPLPEDLSKLTSILPILCMEYCSKGDLRQVLNKPENCCGLQESDVRRLVQNVASAVCYLHSEKITHRDLKPENIVLSQTDSGIIYKLIDLGYAKELDQSSCTSFVGTLQYLAPELFTNEKYSSSVDYWSLGLVSHEVITGVRPFLPNMAPVSWMKHVKRKASEYICAYQTQNGKIEFSSHLFPQNHISSVLRSDMERWLQIVLEWDPKKRGRNGKGEVIVFNDIETILSKKMIRVFCMVTYQRLSYSIDDSTSLAVLREWIEHDTKVPAKEQEILLSNGQPIDENGSVSQCFSGSSQETLFVCKKGILHLPNVPPNLPELVANILQNPREKMEYVFQRRAFSHAIFFMQHENKLYKSFLVGCKLKLLSVILRCQRVIRESQKITDQSNAIAALKELCMDAYKFDSIQANKANINSFTSHWEQEMDSLNRKCSVLHDKTAIVTADAQKVTKLARKLQTGHSTNIKEDPLLCSLLDSGLEVLDKLRRRSTTERSTLRDSLDMVKVIYNFLKQRDCVLHDQGFNGHLKQLIDCEAELIKLMPNLKDLTRRLDTLKQEIMAVNRERQQSVWDILMASIRDLKSFPDGSPFNLNNLFSPPGNKPFSLFRSQSSRSLCGDEQAPPVPPHGIAFSQGAASTQSLFNLYSPSSSQSNLYTPLKTSGPIFDVTDRQQALRMSHLSNGTDSGVVKSLANGSTFSFARYSTDDIASSMISENKSLRVRTQEMMESISHIKKVLTDEDDWSFLRADQY